MVDLVIGAIRQLAARKVVPADLANRPLDGATPIDELGIDSLGKLELITELEDRADVMLSEKLLLGVRTLGDLARAVTTAKEQR